MVPEIKTLHFVGSAREDLSAMPTEVRYVFGHALFLAQDGLKHGKAKPLKGHDFKGAGVLEVVEDFDGNAFRAVYTVRFAGTVFVLHAFQKKSTSGIATPKREIDLVKTRLKEAKRFYEETYLRKAV